MRSALVVVNRHASGGHVDLEEPLQCLRDAGVQVTVQVAPSPHAIGATIRSHAQAGSGIDAVVVGGGDGTLNAAAAAVLEVGLPMGVLPLGTANDFARTLDIPADLHAACALILQGSVRRVDVGWANDRPFLNALGIGLSTRVADRLSADFKRYLGALSYPLAGLELVRRYQPFRVRVQCEGRSVQFRSIQVVVGNGLYYGGGTPVAPDAAIDDGRLDLFSVRPQPLMQLFRVAVAVRRGEPPAAGAGVDVLSGTEMRIETSRPRRVSLDGEPLLRTPLDVRVDPGALPVFAPPASGE